MRFVAACLPAAPAARHRAALPDRRPLAGHQVTGWPDTIWLTEQVRVDRDHALFGELTFDITPKLTATAGVRFFKAKNSLRASLASAAALQLAGLAKRMRLLSGTGAPFHGAPCTNLDKTVNEKRPHAEGQSHLPARRRQAGVRDVFGRASVPAA